MICYTVYVSLFKGINNGWPKSLLVLISTIIILALFPSAQAATSAAQTTIEPQTATALQISLVDNRLFVGLVLAFVVQGIFPIFSYFYTKRKQRDTYMAYIKANVES